MKIIKSKLFFLCIILLAAFLSQAVFALDSTLPANDGGGNQHFQITSTDKNLGQGTPLPPPSSGLNLTPSPYDISVSFLADIFGVVDGVLHGSSQILGTMFGVFNAAVLALGTILGAYVIMVSTLNTAHEGEVLGKNWSSIWIPLRLVCGIVLLLPKASGYSVIQIFVMWVVVQGIGAADSIWNAALRYIGGGGMIIQQPLTSATFPGNQQVLDSSGQILQSLVCMYGLERILNDRRQDRLKQIQNVQNNNGGGAFNGGTAVNANGGNTINTSSNGSGSGKMTDTDPVPSFAQTISNIVGLQPLNAASQYSLNVPNFSNDPNNPNVAWGYYKQFDGVCGKIQWTAILAPATISANTPDMLAQMLQQLQAAKNVAIQQLVNDLSNTARAIVNNYFSTNPLPLGTLQEKDYTTIDSSGDSSAARYYQWVSDEPPSPPLLQGDEIQNAVADYRNIMDPALISVHRNNTQNVNIQNFIVTASQTGWILAGKYFFDLIHISSQVTLNSQMGAIASLSASFNGPNFNGVKKVLETNYYSTLLDLMNAPTNQNVKGSGDTRLAAYVKDASSFPETYQATGTTANSDEDALQHIQFQEIEPSTDTSQSKFLKEVVKVVYKAINATLKGFITIVNGMIDAVNDMTLNDMFNSQATNANPIVLISNFGKLLLEITSALWLIGGLITALVTAVTGIASALNPAPFAVLAYLMWFLPLFMFLMALMFAAGMSMEFLVPLIPYIVFTLGAIGWMIGVIEAMVAAPLVGLAIATPEGHAAMGKSVNGFMLLLGVFLRPSLMLFGFFAGIILSYVGLWLFNKGFFYTLSSFYTESASIALIFYPVTSLCIYIMIVLTIINKSFALIHIVPDKVLRWIGGQPEQLGADVSSGFQEIHRGFEGRAQEAGKAVSSKMGDAGDKMLSRHESAGQRKQGRDEEKAERSKDLSVSGKEGGLESSGTGGNEAGIHVGNNTPGQGGGGGGQGKLGGTQGGGGGGKMGGVGGGGKPPV